MSSDTEVESKGGYHHGELPATLMSLAMEHIEAGGTEKLSLRALAREAGVSPTAPYRHFPTKQCLLAALATQGFEQLHERTLKAFQSGGSTDERFIKLGETYVGFALENPTAYRLMFGSVLGDFSEYEMLRVASERSYQPVQELLQELIDEKNLAQDVALLGGVVWAGVHGMASLLINDMDKETTHSVSRPRESVRALSSDLRRSIQLMFANLVGNSGQRSV
ncbi:MAG: TetR/AcrR family transcriptional regulator [Pseudomonadaceae bacterium]|nr:TetR/AcrR family transcriptional regulator [Pseudomonadaceae bacterium]